jgi:hypothetical protein
MTKKVGVYGNVTRPFDKAADLVGLAPEVRKAFGTTTNEIIVNLPYKMDDGRIERHLSVSVHSFGYGRAMHLRRRAT